MRKLRAIWLAGLAVLLAGLAFGQEPVRIGANDAMSSATNKTRPELSPMARQLKIHGSVDVDVTIDAAGAVEKAETVKGNPVLAKSAIDAVKKWKFKPFKEGKVV
ncbi:MAG: energy transducer TonB, partial [Bryobacteraceae bacterium]